MSPRRTTIGLVPGDSVGVVATGFAAPRAAIAAGLRRIESMGFVPVAGRHLLSRDGYLAGRDEARAEDLNRMLRSPSIRGIWFARGGYGTARILDRVDWKALASDPKVLVGYSDLTALFTAVGRFAPQVCLYGPVVAELSEPRAYHARSLSRLLRGDSIEMRVPARGVLRHGSAQGLLAGGNLTVLAHLVGTPHAPSLRGRILFLEDSAEPMYRIDRALGQLRAAGALDGVAAVLVGSLAAAPRVRPFPPDRSLGDILDETFVSLGVPVVTAIPAGHRPGKWTLPLGGMARLDTRAGRLILTAAAR